MHAKCIKEKCLHRSSDVKKTSTFFEIKTIVFLRLRLRPFGDQHQDFFQGASKPWPWSWGQQHCLEAQ